MPRASGYAPNYSCVCPPHAATGDVAGSPGVQMPRAAPRRRPDKFAETRTDCKLTHQVPDLHIKIHNIFVCKQTVEKVKP